MILTIAGSRQYPDIQEAEAYLDELLKGGLVWYNNELHHLDLLITGGAYNIDKLADYVARKHGIPTDVMTVEDFGGWDGPHKRRVGHVRNEAMADRSTAVAVLWDGISTGSSGMIQYAKRHGKLWLVHTNYAPKPEYPPQQYVDLGIVYSNIYKR